MTPHEQDPARDVEAWDPWADENQDPAPHADRDEDQSASSRPRRGGGDRVVDRDADLLAAPLTPSTSAGGPVDLDQLLADAPAPAPRKPSRPRASGSGTARTRKPTGRPAGSAAAESPDAGPEAADDADDPAADTARRRSSSFGSPKRGSGNSSFGRPKPGSGNSSFGRPEPGGTATSFGRGGGSGSFGSRSSGGSSFGDGSSGFGRSGGRKKSRQKTWGIQLDAEVEEPTPVDPAAPRVFDEAAAAEENAADARRRARAAGGSGGGRGRSGSFDRPRRAEGEPAPVLEDPEATAKQICLTALTGAAKTRHQLAELLAARDVPDEAAEAVLDRFTEVGLIDDAAYAAAWISSRQSGRGLSKRALAQELKTKGVDPEVAAVALEAVDPQDEWDTARALVAKKVPSMRRLDSATATRRLVGMLARKGYGGGLAGIVVREALAADGAAEDAAAVADEAPPELPARTQSRRAGARAGTRADMNAGTSAAPGTEPEVRVGRWSGRPLVEDSDQDGVAVVADETEVGEGLTQDGLARSRPAQRRRSSFGR